MRNRDTTDVIIFEAQFIGLQLDYRRTQADLDIARIILKTLMNRPIYEELMLDRAEFTPDVMVQMAYKYESYVTDIGRKQALEDYFIRAAADKSIGLEQCARRIESQNQRLSAVKGRFWPEISLRAGLSTGEQLYYDEDDPHTIWSIGGLLRWPLNFWGKGRGESSAYRHGMESLEYARDSLRFALAENVSAKLHEFLAYLDVLPDVFDYRRTVKAGLEEYYKSYSEGGLTAMDLAPLLDKYVMAELQAAESIYEFYETYSELLSAAGTGYLIHGSEDENAFYRGLEEFLGLK